MLKVFHIILLNLTLICPVVLFFTQLNATPPNFYLTKPSQPLQIYSSNKNSDMEMKIELKKFDSLLPVWLEIAENAARAAEKILKHHFGKMNSKEIKSSHHDIVTSADLESEKIILQILHQHFPSHQILSEEIGDNGITSDFCWLVDPLDGSTNYAHSYPFCSISIALTYRGKPVLGVILNPINGECFTGIIGRQSKLNNYPIYVSQIKTLKESLLATGFPYISTFTNNNELNFSKLTQISHGVRRDGSAALDLAFVACGRLEGYWEGTIKPWDIAAGIVILEGAGGKVTNYNLQPLNLFSGEILATNGHIHSQLSHQICLNKN